MTPAEAETRTGSRRGVLVLKILGGLAALAALYFIAPDVRGYTLEFAKWVEGQGVWGPIIFALGYAGATVAFVPGSLLTLAAGAIFGLAKGTVTVFFGATLGSALAFLIARYVARDAIARRIAGSPKFAATDRAVAREGLKIVTLLRLVPIFPFALMNYALGLTRVKFRDYLLASIGMIPGTFLYVYYGKGLGSLLAVAGGAEIEYGIEYWVTFGAGLVAALAVTIYVARIAKRALAEEVEDV